MRTATKRTEPREQFISFFGDASTEITDKPPQQKINATAQPVAKIAFTHLYTDVSHIGATDIVIHQPRERSTVHHAVNVGVDSLRNYLFNRGAFTKSLKDVSELLDAHGITWCVGSSGALYIQGVDIRPKDLDIVVDRTDFSRARDALKPLKPGRDEPFTFAGNEFYKFPIEKTAYSAEVAGFDIASDPLIRQDWEGTKVSVHPLSFELGMYEQRPGKAHVAALIRAAM